MRRTGLVLVCMIVLIACPSPAWAGFVQSAHSAGASVSTTTISPPASPSASLGTCVKSASISVRVTWSASASTATSGYTVLRSTIAGGPYAAVGSVIGRQTTTFTDTGAAFSTRYYYVVDATRGGWTARSSQATYLTLNSNCR